jgi:RNA polymerase sigma factor (sigma-70 family)
VNDSSDHLLLRDYAENRSEAAFSELARRYVDFVYCAALRMLRDEHAAQDVTQSVFVALARNARTLAGGCVLSGWLHRTAQNLAANAVRSDVRRRAREQHAAAMNEPVSGQSAAPWEQIAPQLDAVLAQLSQNDRAALLLRYFQNKSIREVAEILKTTEGAAQKRVNRAVERMRKIIARHGVAAGASGLVHSISANAVQPAPAGMASASAAAGLRAGADLATGITTKGFMILQRALATTALAAIVGAALYALHLQQEVRSLQGRASQLARQLEQSQSERDDALKHAAFLELQNQMFQQGVRDLARLRGEVARLRALPPSTAAAVAAPPAAPPPEIKHDPPQVTIDAKFVSLPDDALKSLGIQWTPDSKGGGHSLLTAEQLQAVQQVLTNNEEIEVLAAPRVLTESGRQANLSAITTVALNDTNATEGVTLDVMPEFSTNDSTFNLIIIGQYSALCGDPLQPTFYNLRATNQITVPRGQSMVLNLGRKPDNAWENTSGLPQSCIVLVTPEAVDIAGNSLPAPP